MKGFCPSVNTLFVMRVVVLDISGISKLDAGHCVVSWHVMVVEGADAIMKGLVPDANDGSLKVIGSIGNCTQSMSHSAFTGKCRVIFASSPVAVASAPMRSGR